MTAAMQRALRIAVALLAVLATVWLIRRFSAQPAAPAHEHETVLPSTADSGRTVTLGGGEQRAIGITFAPVERGPIDHVVRSLGIVAYDEARLTTVTSRVDGYVESLAVDFTGERVRRGQAMLTLYAPEIVTAQEEYLLGRTLAAEVRSGTDDARRAADELVAASRRRLENWEVPADEIAALESGGPARRTVTLRARANGFAVEKNVQAGQRIMAGEPLYRLADLGVVWVEGEVYERDLPFVALGTPVEARFTALPGIERRGKVAYVYPTVSAETRTARVRVELPNRDEALRPGMYATLEFRSPAHGGLSIPRGAALVTGKRTLVFLKRPDGRFEPREITLGAATDERYEVLDGLAVGDTVVASGTFLLDAESNLGSMLGGMGGMPGMDMGPAVPGQGPGAIAPKRGAAVDSARPAPARRPPATNHTHG